MKPARTYPFKPDWTLAPGELLREYLMEMQLTQVALAEKMRRPPEFICKLVNGRVLLTPETALQLEAAIGQPAEYWMKLETTHRLFLARKKAKKR